MAVLLNEYKKIQYIIDNLVLPFLKNQHPKWRELIRVYLEFLDENSLDKALNITDNADANDMYSELLDDFLNIYFKDVVDLNKFGLNEDNKRLFISLSKLIHNLKSTETSYGFFFNSFTNFSIPSDSGDINIGDMTIELKEKPEWWLENNDPTRPFTYIFKIDTPELSNLRDLIKQVHPAGWIQLFLFEIDFTGNDGATGEGGDFINGYDCFELDIHYGNLYNGKWDYDGACTVEGSPMPFLYNGGYTISDGMDCGIEPRHFTIDGIFSFEMTSALSVAAIEITVQPVGGEKVTSPSSPDITISVTASGSNREYQWYREGVGALAGETGRTLTFTDADDTDRGVYYVHVWNSFSEEYSDHVFVTFTSCVVTPLSDDFTGINGDPPDTERWNVSGLGMSEIQDNQLQIGSPTVYQQTVATKFRLYGDFSVTVDYEIINQVGNFTSLFEIVHVGGLDYYFMHISNSGGGTLRSWSRDNGFNKLQVTTPWPHYTGKMRMVREGHIIYYWGWNSTDGWVNVATWDSTAYQSGDWDVGLDFRQHEQDPIAVWDNFEVIGNCSPEPYLGTFVSTANIASAATSDLRTAEIIDRFTLSNGSLPTAGPLSAPDPSWTKISDVNSRVTIQNEKMEFNSPALADDFAEYRINNFTLDGEFILEADISWTGDFSGNAQHSKVMFGFYTTSHGTNCRSGIQYRGGVGYEEYQYWGRTDEHNGGSTGPEVLENPAKVRIWRDSAAGGVMRTYYWRNNVWNSMYAAGCTMSTATPWIDFRHYSGVTDMVVQVDNFKVVTADTINWI